jgi:hypothetical protein
LVQRKEKAGEEEHDKSLSHFVKKTEMNRIWIGQCCCGCMPVYGVMLPRLSLVFILAGVPRVYSRVYDKIMQGLEKKGRIAK